eukprot:scaffold226032_cov10-Tisochrysis_lutea.AAC.1
MTFVRVIAARAAVRAGAPTGLVATAAAAAVRVQGGAPCPLLSMSYHQVCQAAVAGACAGQQQR